MDLCDGPIGREQQPATRHHNVNKVLSRRDYTWNCFLRTYIIKRIIIVGKMVQVKSLGGIV